MSSRRTFLKQMSAAGLLGIAPTSLIREASRSKDKIWAGLLHLSFNMWEEYVSPHRPFRGYQNDLRLSAQLWDDAINRMAKVGLNMVVIDLGDSIRYDSHPEIAVNNAWSVDYLRRQLSKMRSFGLEPIPKLNFSAAHDVWMKDYSKMVSTEAYYTFCKNIIGEVIDIFDKPRFFHLGMDEETAAHQKYYRHVVVRKNDLWWSDFYRLVDAVEKGGSRAWLWSDYLWHHPESFFEKMPNTVIQSNWYYGEEFDDLSAQRVKAYLQLEEHGYDQIPTGSFHNENYKSIGNTVRFVSEHVRDNHLLGILQTFWKPTIEEYRALILNGIDLAGEAKQWYENQ